MHTLWARAITITLLAGVGWLIGASPAWADTAYRYWSFWTVSEDSWAYANVGPASLEARDGDAYGWRFGISTEQGSPEAAPRTEAGELFERGCADAVHGEDQVRVAFFLDAGESVAAPDGQVPPAPRITCAVVPKGSTTAIALSAVTELRVDAGFVCGIDGYPEGECAPAIALPESAGMNTATTPLPSTGEDSHTGESDSPAATIIVVSIGAIAGILIFVVLRRRAR
ncbi:MAG: hypothetical protein RJB01_1878 [Actinomycetota bacterium]